MAIMQLTKFLTFLLVMVFGMGNSALSAEGDKDRQTSASLPEGDVGTSASEASVRSGEKFYPNITSGAETTGAWNIEWQETPTELSSDLGFFANNVSIGIGDRLEVGIVPYRYFVYMIQLPGDLSINVYHTIIKWNFFKSDQFSLGVVYSGTATHMKTNIDLPTNDGLESNIASGSDQTIRKRIDIKLYEHQYAFLTNFRFLSGWNLGANVRGTYMRSGNTQADVYYQRTAIFRRLVHIRTDLMQTISPAFRLTYSLSREYLQDLENAQYDFKLVHGSGCGLTWVRPGKTIGSVGFGFHKFVETGTTDHTLHLSLSR